MCLEQHYLNTVPGTVQRGFSYFQGADLGDKAVEWYRKAALQGSENAKEALKRLGGE